MKEITKKAVIKVKQELDNYREKQISKTAKEVYDHTTRHMFVEATAHYSTDLIRKSEEIAKLVLVEEANTIDCAEAVMKVARNVGCLGSITLEVFYNAIWDYYKIDHKRIKEIEKNELLKKQQVRKKREQKRKKSTMKKDTIQPNNNNDLQLSLF
ncbi:hypothetical protein SH1V18_48170 [Vallitalea longa]|uniref:PcfK-like protein n=1 Tax=Vallitalea longa TaxID=2936439 RepID=A0A9W5YF44_9FIRM|nr:Cas9 inhibitor AcrIIA9 family protein [Vallitalea longa]GKX32337.1 hypothetical protein SH1V18_48170 [Vallitalea longa]